MTFQTVSGRAATMQSRLTVSSTIVPQFFGVPRRDVVFIDGRYDGRKRTADQVSSIATWRTGRTPAPASASQRRSGSPRRVRSDGEYEQGQPEHPERHSS
jgi:hypothetical protein